MAVWGGGAVLDGEGEGVAGDEGSGNGEGGEGGEEGEEEIAEEVAGHGGRGRDGRRGRYQGRGCWVRDASAGGMGMVPAGNWRWLV